MQLADNKRMVLVAIVLMVLPLLTACGGDDDSQTPRSTPLAETTLESVTITIGNFTDQTGIASKALQYTNMAFEDMVAYYNEINRIPGVEFDLIHYDGQYNPANVLNGYEWLKDNGADVIVSCVPLNIQEVRPHLEKDEIVLFLLASTEEQQDSAGYILPLGDALSKSYSHTILKWIAENDLDFPQDRPAKIGGAAWMDETVSRPLLEGAQEYAQAHSDQFEWVGGHLTDFTFVWSNEVESLRDCDYVLTPVPMSHFVKQYRDAGYGAKFIGGNAHIAFLESIYQQNLWDEIDGMLVVNHQLWWSESSEMMDLVKTLLNKNHADNADEIMQAGIGYLTVYNAYKMLELITCAVENSGPENFSSQAVREASRSFTMTINGVEGSGLTQINQIPSNCLGIFEVQGDLPDLRRVSETCVPIVREIQ